MSVFDTGIRPAVDAHLAKKAAEERDYGDYWSASSVGYCMRLNIMRRLKVPKVPELEDNAAQTRIFEAGHIFHEWMQRITKDAGLSIASEVELQDEDLMVRGHFDDLVLVTEAASDAPHNAPSQQEPYEGSRKLILYDYKTAHSASFNYSKGRPMGHYHQYQLGTYMYMLRQRTTLKHELYDGIEELSEARILSISKDDLRMDEKQLIWSEKLEQAILSYWNELNAAWKTYNETGALPPCTCLEYDGGFMGRRSSKGKIYNDYFWEEEPCSQRWFSKWQKEQMQQEVSIA